MAYAMGCILTPLRGCRVIVLFHRVVEILVLTHTLEALRHQETRVFQQSVSR
jgi:hypothetical protein